MVEMFGNVEAEGQRKYQPSERLNAIGNDGTFRNHKSDVLCLHSSNDNEHFECISGAAWSDKIPFLLLSSHRNRNDLGIL